MIDINHLTKSLPDKKLLEISHLNIHEQDKIALIGENGAGKTTLMKIILGLDQDYTGTIHLNGAVDYLLNDAVRKQSFAAETYAKANLPRHGNYSPGEYQRLKLAHLLASDDQFLLLDEPTSHLDIKQKEALIAKLTARKTGYLIISHDRDFINRTCKQVLELINGNIERYNGNYAFYVTEKEKREKFKEREYEHYLKEKRRLENLAVTLQEQSAKVKTTPKRMGNSEARLHKMGGQGNKKKLDKQAKSVQARLQQLAVKEKPQQETEIKLSLPEKEKIHAKILLKAEHIHKSWGENILFKDAHFQVANNRKTALIGDNGTGKTTLIKMMVQGEGIWKHPNLKIGYFSQLADILEEDQTILANILPTSIYDETMTRIVLARLGFKNTDSLKTVNTLSNGEKAKVKLAKILTSDFNYLIFDEPTNFLDIQAIASLESLLKNNDRPFLFVSHDEALINNLADHLLIIEDHQITAFSGNLKAYQEQQKRQKKNHDADDMLLDFRISTINARLTMEISATERKTLQEEYQTLIALKNQHKVD